jgi:hypothetical protein
MRFRHLVWATALAAALPALAIAQDEPGVPPPPPPPVRVAAIPNGYTITLNRPTAELLARAVENADEKQIAQRIRDEAAKRKESDPDSAAKLELIAFIVKSQLPAFKKELAEKMGPNGVVIQVTGLQKPEAKFKRPAMQKAAGIVRQIQPLLPPDAQLTVEALRAMARTTPLAWKVEPIP